MLVPIGVIEQHGPHLPLATDAYGAYLVSVLTKAELEKRGIARAFREAEHTRFLE
jgi:creatinine amidohydrolase